MKKWSSDSFKTQIDIIYNQVKKSEKKSKTNYLFKGLENNNVEKTANKLDKMNSIVYIPRN